MVTGHFCHNCVGLMNRKTLENVHHTSSLLLEAGVDSVDFCIECRTVLRFVYSQGHQPTGASIKDHKDSKQSVGTHYTTGSPGGGGPMLHNASSHHESSVCERERSVVFAEESVLRIA